jgi:hypothetical protein
LRARAAPDYMKVVRAPISELRLALEIGSTKTKEEREREREVWNRDMALLRSPQVEQSRDAVFRAGEIEKVDPEAYLALLETHHSFLLGIADQMEHVDQLQIGYWVDRISVVLVRLKRWDEAKLYIERFFALPDRYRLRFSPSVQASMMKRLERCRLRVG